MTPIHEIHCVIRVWILYSRRRQSYDRLPLFSLFELYAHYLDSVHSSSRRGGRRTADPAHTTRSLQVANRELHLGTLIRALPDVPLLDLPPRRRGRRGGPVDRDALAAPGVEVPQVLGPDPHVLLIDGNTVLGCSNLILRRHVFS